LSLSELFDAMLLAEASNLAHEGWEMIAWARNIRRPTDADGLAKRLMGAILLGQGLASPHDNSRISRGLHLESRLTIMDG
jgi:hypothetical protein